MSAQKPRANIQIKTTVNDQNIEDDVDEGVEMPFDVTFKVTGGSAYDSSFAVNDREYDDANEYMMPPYPLTPEELIREQQLASFQMLHPLLIHNDKNVSEVLSEIRVSLDCLSKVVLGLNNTISKLVLEQKSRSIDDTSTN